MRKYYTLIVKEPGEEWSPQFGDYDRGVVADEGDGMKSSAIWDRKAKMKIICTGDKQADIDAEIARLNYEPKVTPEMVAAFSWKGKR